MITTLHLENIAVIEQADVEFLPGLNVLTGETGAGKSIIIDAIDAVLGGRVSKELIRAGADAARISAVFVDYPASVGAILREEGFDDSESELILSREVLASGRSSARLQGRPVTAAQLRLLGSLLLSTLGQHDTLSLLSEERHLAVLDLFAAHDDLRGEYHTAYQSWRDAVTQRDGLRMDEAERNRRLEMLAYQCNEIESAGLVMGEEEELSSRRKLLKNAGHYREVLDAAYLALYGDEESAGACDSLSSATDALAEGAALDDALTPLSERLNETRYATEDILAELRDLREEFSFDPQELDEIEQRLDVLFRLKRKYGGSVAEVIAFGEQARAEWELLSEMDSRLAELDAEVQKKYQTLVAVAAKLTESRIQAGKRFSEQMLKELEELDMGRARFEVSVTPLEGESPYQQTGGDNLLFLMSTNPGEPVGPLNKIASGGELSRVMLSIQNILAGRDEVGTMVFDEVDSGISGRAALRVAEKLAQVSREKQVLCVTHLPQMAAMADSHFYIEKHETGGRTVTKVRILDDEGRRSEIARIIGGQTITALTLQNAAELMEMAASFKEEKR